MVKISVIICTYNDAKCLKQALLSLVDQSLGRNLYEILVVDNNSSDETTSQIKSFQHKFTSPKIRLIKEEKQGLGYARNRGLKFAKGEYVAFIDDDAKADEHWLENTIKIMEDDRLKPIAVGGVIIPFYNSKKPVWFKDEYETRSWGKESRFLKKGESFSGSNMIYKREIFDKYGGFREDIGMRGEIMSVGEETSLFERIWNDDSNSLFYYSSNLIIYHLVPDYKMRVSYQLERSFTAGQAKALRNKKELWYIRLFKTMIYLTSTILYFILAIFQIVKYRYYQNWLIEKSSPIAYCFGYVAYSLGFRVNFRPVRD